jgi:uncharacterized protein with HEPN domain
MPREELVREILGQMRRSLRLIERRFAGVTAALDFVASDDGLDRLDAICMQLIALGEATKNLDKVTEGQLLPRYGEIEWRRIMGMRDFLSHHYSDTNEEIVFNACAKYVPRLRQAVEQMLRDLDNS